jgi:hypothetical protein
VAELADALDLGSSDRKVMGVRPSPFAPTSSSEFICDDEAGRYAMTIHLKPELERLIQKDVERGPYETADEYVERAVQMLHEQEEWL